MTDPIIILLKSLGWACSQNSALSMHVNHLFMTCRKFFRSVSLWCLCLTILEICFSGSVVLEFPFFFFGSSYICLMRDGITFLVEAIAWILPKFYMALCNQRIFKGLEIFYSKDSWTDKVNQFSWCKLVW